MRKKILFIMNSLNFGGAEKALVNLLNTIDYRKADIDLLLLSNEGELLSEIDSRVNVVKSPAIVSNYYKKNLRFDKLIIKFFITGILTLCTNNRAFANQLRWKYFYKNIFSNIELEYDVAVSFLQGDPLYFMVDKINARKKIAWIHTDYSKTINNRNFDEWYLKKVDSVVTISDKCKQSLEIAFPDVRTIVLPNIVNASVISKYAVMKELVECDTNQDVLLTVGRLVEIKGIDFLLEVAFSLKSKGLKYNWYVLGDGELKEKLLRERDSKKLNDCVHFLGNKKNPYVYMEKADIVIQTSRFEGKSLVLDEAKILQKLIISTDYNTVHDQIIDGKEGIICPFDEDKFSNTIINLISDKQKQNTIKQFLRSNSYGNEGCVNEYYELFEI